MAEDGNAVKKLDSSFRPQDFGKRSLGSLLRRAADLFDLRNDETNQIVYHLRMKEEKSQLIGQSSIPANWPSHPSFAMVPPALKLTKGKVHNLRLGFGFIRPDDGTENLFFHATDVEGCTIFDLKPGDPVEYEPGANEKGPCGRKVRRIV